MYSGCWLVVRSLSPLLDLYHSEKFLPFVHSTSSLAYIIFLYTGNPLYRTDLREKLHFRYSGGRLYTCFALFRTSTFKLSMPCLTGIRCNLQEEWTVLPCKQSPLWYSCKPMLVGIFLLRVSGAAGMASPQISPHLIGKAEHCPT